jgi:hypothetical protein
LNRQSDGKCEEDEILAAAAEILGASDRARAFDGLRINKLHF